MEHSLVSIIIPIYNVSDYLDACIQSACNQTYSYLEIILVDDGSTDDCPQKCDNWANIDPRITVIHKKNGGLSDARNAGLDIATGKYIYFLDGDDTIKTDLIETVVKYMDDGADMVSFRYNKIFSGGYTKIAMYDTGLFELHTPKDRVKFLFQTLLPCHIGWEAWSRIYSHEIIRKFQLRFVDNSRIFAEDLYFAIVFCAHAKKIYSISNILYNYFLRQDSIMDRNKEKLNIGRFNELGKSLKEHFIKYEECKPLIKCFPAIHYMIIDRPLMKAIHDLDISPREFRRYIMEDIDDYEFFEKQMKELPNYRRYLCLCFSGSQTEERLSFVKYLLNGHYTGLRIRNRIIYKFADFFDRNSLSMRSLQIQYQRSEMKKNRIFYIGGEDYGNIGDYQINEATVAFLHEEMPEYEVIEVPMRQWQNSKPFLKKYIRKKDIIISNGGGNFGNNYSDSMKVRKEIIHLWPNNPKIIFPQTIFFSNDTQGKYDLLEAQELYTNSNRIILFTRDRSSYSFAQEHFSCESYLIPDIVLTTIVKIRMQRKPIALMCFRSDKEKAMDDKTQSILEEICKSFHMAIQYTDLQLEYNSDRKDQKKIIDQKLEEWSQVGLVLTDRLHGMIFAAITGTPCIAFSNYNHKVKETYEWIKYLPYIKYAESVDQAKEHITELLEMKDCRFDNTPLQPYFNKLSQILREYGEIDNCAKNKKFKQHIKLDNA